MGTSVSTLKGWDPSHHTQTHDVAVEHPGPISLVPDDVLYLVLACVAQAEPVRGINDLSRHIHDRIVPSYYECLGWMRLSAVCRRWRAILLTSASLWAGVVFHLPPGAAALALARSSGASIDTVIPTNQSTRLLSSPRGISISIRSSKGWGEPRIHRERLLKLAFTHGARMKRLVAADLTADHYRHIFGNTIFNSLRILELDHVYHNPHATPAPTRKQLGWLHISAPHVYRAHLSIYLPIAYDNGPGLSFRLPNLRYLFLNTPFVRRVLSATKLRWIPSLIRGAVGLQHLKIHIPPGVFIDWDELCGEGPIHLPALRSVDLGGSLDAHMHQLYSRLSKSPLPWSHFSSVSGLTKSEAFEFIRLHGETIGHSLCTYPLDSVYISRGWKHTLATTFSFTAFSSPGMAGPYPSPDELLEDVYKYAHHSARLEAHILWFWAMEQTGHLNNAGEALDILTPLLVQNTIQELYLDDIMVKDWLAAIFRFMHSCLSGITTLHCIESGRLDIPAALIRPCTNSLRVFSHRCNDLCVQAEAPEYELEPSDSASNRASRRGSQENPTRNAYFLPKLHTVIVTMRITENKQKRKLRTMLKENNNDAYVLAWWDELILGMTHRRDMGLPIRVLRIIGGWKSEKLRGRTATMDGRMLACVGELVGEVVDERRVDPNL